MFPYQVSLRTSIIDFHFCGGSIISRRWILSAAHCFIDRSIDDNLYAFVGTVSLVLGATRLRLVDLVRYPDYNPAISDILYDIAMVKTGPTIVFTANVAPIDMGSIFFEGGKQANASGWGQTTVSFFIEF